MSLLFINHPFATDPDLGCFPTWLMATALPKAAAYDDRYLMCFQWEVKQFVTALLDLNDPIGRPEPEVVVFSHCPTVVLALG